MHAHAEVNARALVSVFAFLRASAEGGPVGVGNTTPRSAVRTSAAGIPVQSRTRHELIFYTLALTVHAVRATFTLFPGSRVNDAVTALGKCTIQIARGGLRTIITLLHGSKIHQTVTATSKGTIDIAGS